MRWIAQQKLSRVLLIASAWPLAIGAYIAVRIAPVFLPDSGEARLVSFHVSSWLVLVALLLAPPALVIAIWLLARRRSVPPLPNGQL